MEQGTRHHVAPEARPKGGAMATKQWAVTLATLGLPAASWAKMATMRKTIRQRLVGLASLRAVSAPCLPRGSPAGHATVRVGSLPSVRSLHQRRSRTPVQARVESGGPRSLRPSVSCPNPLRGMRGKRRPRDGERHVRVMETRMPSPVS